MMTDPHLLIKLSKQQAQDLLGKVKFIQDVRYAYPQIEDLSMLQKALESGLKMMEEGR